MNVDGGFSLTVGDFAIGDSRFHFNDQDFLTFTGTEQAGFPFTLIVFISRLQKLVEESVEEVLEENAGEGLNRKAHIEYVLRNLLQQPVYYVSSPHPSFIHSFRLQKLDASRSWHCFWGLHSLRLLDFAIPADLQKKCAVYPFFSLSVVF